MRNDAFDQPGTLPILTAGRERIADYAPPGYAESSSVGQVLLWLLVLVLLGALAGLTWWAQAEIHTLERQLVATQESFAHVGEDASSRLRELSSKLAAFEATPAHDVQQLKARLTQLEQQLAGLSRGTPLLDSQQQLLSTRQEDQQRRLDEHASRLDSLNAAQQSLQTQLTTLHEQAGLLSAGQAQLSAAQEDQAQRHAASLAILSEQLESLKRQSPDSAPIKRLEQELLVLRTELERPTAPVPAPKSAASTQEFDLFRAQTTRHITALQGQIANLQAQLDKR